MRFLMTAAFVGLSTMSAAFFVAANSDAHAQKSKASSSAPSAVHGIAPAAPLARALQQREAERKRQAQRAGVNAGTKKMFQQRQSAYDQMHGLMHGNAKAKQNMIRRLQKSSRSTFADLLALSWKSEAGAARRAVAIQRIPVCC